MNCLPEESTSAHLESMFEAVRSISAVALQIDLALREAEGPMGRVADAVARMGATLSSLQNGSGAVRSVRLDLSVNTPLGGSLAGLHEDYLRAVEDLQFHDRLAQHLGLLRNYLADVSTLLARTVKDEAEQQQGRAKDRKAEWDALADRLYHGLITDVQRQFLLHVLPAEGGRGRVTTAAHCGWHASPGSVELF
jgi:hypothetical protein